jgi:hypothetical protein
MMEEKSTFTSLNDGDGGNEISTRRGCYFLRLPPELLVKIASLLVSKTRLTVLPEDNYSSLISFSSSHTYLREVGFSARLFSRICPKSNFEGFKEFGDSLNIRCITSLSVDLGNQNVWPFCADVMKSQPDLNELCVIGETSNHTAEFCASDLAKRFTEFKGRSIVFRKSVFDLTSVPVLTAIGGRGTVKSLFFDGSVLDFHPDETRETLGFPLFPSVKRIKYIKSPSESLSGITVFVLVYLFMTNCPLTHFEMSSGKPPSCCGARENDDPNFNEKVLQMKKTNEPQNWTLQCIYNALREFSLKSLKVFLDSDPRTEIFNDLDPYHSLARRLPSFPRMKLLVLTVKNIHELLDEKQPTDHQYCSLATARSLSGSKHHHSVWRYLSDRYASFYGCDCVVVETGSHGRGDEVYKPFWELATEMLLDYTYRLVKKVGAFRYFIVGNSMDGYSGIEKVMEHWITPEGRIHWAYRKLEKETCKGVLLERGFALR